MIVPGRNIIVNSAARQRLVHIRDREAPRHSCARPTQLAGSWVRNLKSVKLIQTTRMIG